MEFAKATALRISPSPTLPVAGSSAALALLGFAAGASSVGATFAYFYGVSVKFPEPSLSKESATIPESSAGLRLLEFFLAILSACLP